VSAGLQPPVEAAAGSNADVARRLESTISRLLVAGIYLAMGLVLVGVLLMLAAGIDPLAHGGVPPFELATIPAEIAAGNPLGFLWLGLVAVLALPLGRVTVAGVGFLAAHDTRLALVSLAVLLVVLGSIVAAIGLEG
jgi:uncharacterized membrane protein